MKIEKLIKSHSHPQAEKPITAGATCGDILGGTGLGKVNGRAQGRFE
jgi:hypothetical protein